MSASAVVLLAVCPDCNGSDNPACPTCEGNSHIFGATLDITKLFRVRGERKRIQGGWCQEVSYSYNNGRHVVPLPGHVAVQHVNGKDEVRTIDNQGNHVDGWDVRWLVRQAGFEPVEGVS
jgi:hypothetical protein